MRRTLHAAVAVRVNPHKMRLAAVGLAAALAVHAGVVKGVVLENLSGLPLARTLVRLVPVPRADGRALRSMQTRAETTGQFLFLNVEDGLYLLIAEREGYFPAAHGQRRPSGHGRAFEASRDSDLFTELRMWRKGAITGRVLDENGVGMPRVPVIAYPARLPLRNAARGVSDDRGVYRVFGLEPGKHWVRSAAHTLEDGSGRMPTFGPESFETRDARIHIARLDAETPDADVRPLPGALFTAIGTVTCGETDPQVRVNVTLSSETGRRHAQTGCVGGGYSFEGLSPGFYEVLAETTTGLSAGFVEFQLNSPRRDSLSLFPPPTANFQVRRPGSPGAVDIPVTVTGRRQDYAEVQTEQPIRTPSATLAPGHWEMHAQVPPDQYVVSIASSPNRSRRSWRVEPPPDSYEVYVDPSFAARVTITVADHAARISGRVVDAGKPVAGAPVFLWPAAAEARRSLRGWKLALSDTEGGFRFESLPPGDYRLLATFDVSEVDEDILEQARAETRKTEAGRMLTVELTLWLAP